jgi:hypothetical protein
MHTMFVTVDIKPGRLEEAQNSLKTEVVPMVSKAPGFVRGLWWNSDDGATGHGLVVFENEEFAKQAASQGVDAPDHAPVSFRSLETGPLNAEA